MGAAAAGVREAGVAGAGATDAGAGVGAAVAGSAEAGAGELGAVAEGRWDCANGAIRLQSAADADQVTRQAAAAANMGLNTLESFLVIALV